MVNSYGATEASVDRVFRALANSVRRDLVSRLLSGEEPVAELAEGISISAPAISRHLKVLEEASVISRRRDGRKQMISLNSHTLGSAMGWLGAHGARWQRSFDALDVVLTDDDQQGEA